LAGTSLPSAENFPGSNRFHATTSITEHPAIQFFKADLTTFSFDFKAGIYAAPTAGSLG
jgi:hypothetical protein